MILRKAVLTWLEKQGKNIKGTVLHAGSGVDYYKYSQFFPHASQYVNLDKKKQDNVDIVANVEYMPIIPPASVDCVLAIFMLHQVSDVKAALTEFKRVLKANGVFLGEFAAPGWKNLTEGNHRWTFAGALETVGHFFAIQESEKHSQNEKLVSTFIRGIKLEE